jgi:S1-C subfamily serine protease
MSDRSEDIPVERVQDPNTAAPVGAGVGNGTGGSGAWAVPSGGHPEPPSPAATDPSNAPTWPGTTVTEERPTQEHPWTSPPSDAYGFTRTDPMPPGPPGGSRSGSSDRRGRSWFLVAVVAALIGAGVGAGVTALTDHNNSSSTLAPIKESNAAPGAAIDGGANIPSLVRELMPAVVSIDVKTAGEEDEGTGMIISADGMVVTNFHVIALAAQDGGALTVTESGSTAPVKATLVGTDQTDDVALLKINGASNLKTITFGDSDKAVVGDAVVAIGNALGLSEGSPTVTQGIVSAIGRTVTAGDPGSGTETLTNLIQTDAAINPGNSGGPLVDSAGQVIAMNTAVAGSTSDGTNAQNIGFAIPSAQIESLLPNLENGGTKISSPGYMGVNIETLTPELRSQYNFTPTSGAAILQTVPGGPADSAGLREGDIIVQVGSKKITSSADLLAALQGDKAGQTIKITFYRGTNKRTVSLTLITQQALQNLEIQGVGSGFGGAGGVPGGGFGLTP